MKYIKTYEQSINQEPQEGNYVIVGKKSKDVDWNKFPYKKLLKEIGVITNYNEESDVYTVKFPSREWYFYKEHFEFFSSDKKDIEVYLSTKKYNL